MNYPKDTVETQRLADYFKDVYKKMGPSGFDLKEYNGLWAQCAPRASLADLDHLTMCLLKVSPALNVGYNDILQAVANTFHEFNCTVLEPKQVAKKLMVAQKHTRNLKLGSKADASLAILDKRMTVAQKERLAKVLSLVRKGITNESEENAKGEAEKTPARSRTLKPVPSDVSLDENGNPTWGFMSKLARGSSADSVAGSTGSSKEGDMLLSGAHTKGIYSKSKKTSPLKKPASPMKVAMKIAMKTMPKTSMKVAMKSGLLSTDEVLKGPFKVHGPFLKTGKSYVTCYSGHVVTVTRKQSKQYHKVLVPNLQLDPQNEESHQGGGQGEES